MSDVVDAAVRRWLDAALLLSCAGRAPGSALSWLGQAWTGTAAGSYEQWAKSFEQASHRAASALRAAADSLRDLLHTWPELRLDTDLDGVDAGSRQLDAVPVPGNRPAEPVPGDKPAEAAPGHRPAEPESAPPPPPAQPPAETLREGTVDGWIQQAVRVLLDHGYRPEQIDPEAIATIIKHESSGNPEAVNRWDSNAARGTPSMGLMQTIGPTFERYHLPGHGEILNPVDNIIAGVRYAVDRYGSVSRVPGVLSLAAGGRYRGY